MCSAHISPCRTYDLMAVGRAISAVLRTAPPFLCALLHGVLFRTHSGLRRAHCRHCCQRSAALACVRRFLFCICIIGKSAGADILLLRSALGSFLRPRSYPASHSYPVRAAPRFPRHPRSPPCGSRTLRRFVAVLFRAPFAAIRNIQKKRDEQATRLRLWHRRR